MSELHLPHFNNFFASNIASLTDTARTVMSSVSSAIPPLSMNTVLQRLIGLDYVRTQAMSAKKTVSFSFKLHTNVYDCTCTQLLISVNQTTFSDMAG